MINIIIGIIITIIIIIITIIIIVIIIIIIGSLMLHLPMGYWRDEPCIDWDTSQLDQPKSQTSNNQDF